jgi:hypothetical protein
MTSAYLRARIALFQDTLATIDSRDSAVALLRNGVFPDSMYEARQVQTLLRQRPFPDHPLDFTELCTFNTWFTRHPEKVCGTEVITSSREFPITIKGNRQTIEQTIGQTLQIRDNTLELEALALEIELKLLTL